MTFTFRLMGYSCYSDYLASDHWKTLRRAVFARDNAQCQLCCKPGEVVHHMDYKLKTMTGKKASMLITLCHQCHHELEHDADGRRIHNVDVKKQMLDRRMISIRGINVSQWKQGIANKKHTARTTPPNEPLVTRKQRRQEEQRERRRAKMTHGKKLVFVRPQMHSHSPLTRIVSQRRCSGSQLNNAALDTHRQSDCSTNQGEGS